MNGGAANWAAAWWEHAYSSISHLLVQMKQPVNDEIGQKSLLFPGITLPFDRENNPFFDGFWNGGWGGYAEFYASMLEWCDADQACIPEVFREFYDWDKIDAWLIKKDL